MVGNFKHEPAVAGKWQLFDGVHWKHNFETYEQAKYYGEKFGAQRVGKSMGDGEYRPQVLLTSIDEVMYGSD